MDALARALPKLAARIPRVALGDWPTPLTETRLDGGTVWVKHEGASSALYGGNKVRTLEVWFGHARDRGVQRLWSIGAYGSNHAIATILHAPRAAIEAGAILFPQPSSEWAVENCGAILASGCPVIRLRSVVEVPLAALVVGRQPGALVMPPGGATTLGAFGAMSAAFELAEQIASGIAPPPRRIVLAIGSTCTTAGLLAGFALAHAAGTWRWALPIIHGVRVTPWPVTSRLRIAEYALRTLAHVERLGGPRVPITLGELHTRLHVDGRELGQGYGRVTDRAMIAMRALVGPRLDGVYAAKAAAALLRLHRAGQGPLVFWSSKSTALMGEAPLASVRAAPFAIRKWLRGS
ncbi:MAG: pyridoxal-phosphate dependent enzyme [Deltaproteobacteria bacterium]|nr:pyridoxal-phosphate dependent enzyme [Deltaproteobacteria bacterium]